MSYNVTDTLIAKVLYDDMRGMDKLIQADIEAGKVAEQRYKDSVAHTLKTRRKLAELQKENDAKIEILVDENERLNTELDIMREVVISKKKVIEQAVAKLKQVDNYAVSLEEELTAEKKEKEIIQKMLFEASTIELAEVNNSVRKDMVEERVLLHKWMLSRDSFWELSYRLAKENGLDITMDELKEKAKIIQEEILKNGFSAPEQDEELMEFIKDGANLINEEKQNIAIGEELDAINKLKKEHGILSMEDQLELVRIEKEMNLLKRGIVNQDKAPKK